MHDKNGHPLNVGDTVIILAKITQVSATPDFCNVYVETVYGRRPDDKKENISGINTGVMVFAGNSNEENHLRRAEEVLSADLAADDKKQKIAAFEAQYRLDAAAGKLTDVQKITRRELVNRHQLPAVPQEDFLPKKEKKSANIKAVELGLKNPEVKLPEAKSEETKKDEPKK